MATTPPTEPNPVDVALAEHLGLPLDEVVDGFETLPSGVVRWRQVDSQGHFVQHTVRLEQQLLVALVDRARHGGCS